MNAIPTLSSKGWAVTPEERLDAIVLYYQSMNASMSNRYKGAILSLQNSIWAAGGDMERVASLVQSDLNTIMGNNFPEGATVTVSTSEITTDSAQYNLTISATVISNGKTYDLASSLDATDSRFMDAFDVSRVTSF